MSRSGGEKHGRGRGAAVSKGTCDSAAARVSGRV